MKLDEALRTDPELRADIEHFFAQKRQRTFRALEATPAHEDRKLLVLKISLDVLRELRFRMLRDKTDA